MAGGTPAYMSPEQLFVETVDGRSDLYATGLVLYECLTGSLPFASRLPIARAAETLRHVPTPPASLRLDVPPALSRLVESLLASLPENRPGSAHELARRLAQVT